MITERKIVLVVNDEHSMHDINYEAIEKITDASCVPEVWRRNMTPAILRKDADDVMRKFPYLMCPDFIFGPDHFISFCHQNGFECGEYISGKKFDTAKDRCFLCALGKHIDRDDKPIGPLFLFNQSTTQINDIIMYESENFFVKIEYGCLKKGMVMINPKEHIFSASEIPDEQMDEYEEVKRDIEFLLKAMYGDEPVIFFEHGASPTGFSSHQRSIVHAHTHVAWGITLEEKYQKMVCLHEVKDVRDLKGSKYFSYQEGTDGKLLAVSDPKVYVQRQYPRQVIGLQLGIPNEKTNWRNEGFMENIKETFRDFYAYLKANRQFLSERIVKATEGFMEGYPMRSDR